MTGTTELVIDPHRLDFANIKRGEHSTGFFTIENRGTGILNGTIETSHPWIKTSLTTINQKPGASTVLVTITADHLDSGKNDKGYIRISTNSATEMLEIRLATSEHVWPPSEKSIKDKTWLLISVGIIVSVIIILVIIIMILLALGYIIISQ